MSSPPAIFTLSKNHQKSINSIDFTDGSIEFLVFGDDTIISIIERDICTYFPTDDLKISHVIESMGSFIDQLKNTLKSTQEIQKLQSPGRRRKVAR